jgi:hypothetical protein
MLASAQGPKLGIDDREAPRPATGTETGGAANPSRSIGRRRCKQSGHDNKRSQSPLIRPSTPNPGCRGLSPAFPCSAVLERRIVEIQSVRLFCDSGRAGRCIRLGCPRPVRLLRPSSAGASSQCRSAVGYQWRPAGRASSRSRAISAVVVSAGLSLMARAAAHRTMPSFTLTRSSLSSGSRAQFRRRSGCEARAVAPSGAGGPKGGHRSNARDIVTRPSGSPNAAN